MIVPGGIPHWIGPTGVSMTCPPERRSTAVAWTGGPPSSEGAAEADAEAGVEAELELEVEAEAEVGAEVVAGSADLASTGGEGEPTLPASAVEDIARGARTATGREKKGAEPTS